MAVKTVLLGAASLMVLIDLILIALNGRKGYEKTGLKDFLLEDYFFIGERLMALFRRDISGKRIRKLLEIYDSAFAGRVAKSASAAPLTYGFLFVPVIFCVLAVSENIPAAVALLVLVFVLMYWFDFRLDQTLKTRHAVILREFATVLSKMSLLVNAGITASDAFSRVAVSGGGILYREMKRTSDEMENGRPFSDALDDFAFRCGCREVRKFVSLYKQNIVKGGPEFPLLLSAMADNAWEERKARARVLGAAAEQKLLAPIMLMFIGVLIMVIVPAFNSLL